MHPVIDKEELREIVDLVRRYLAPYQPEDYKLVVDPDTVHRDDESYFVVVNPDRMDVSAYDYSSRLAEAEQDLEDNEHRNILLLPVIPD